MRLRLPPASLSKSADRTGLHGSGTKHIGAAGEQITFDTDTGHESRTLEMRTSAGSSLDGGSPWTGGFPSEMASPIAVVRAPVATSILEKHYGGTADVLIEKKSCTSSPVGNVDESDVLTEELIKSFEDLDEGTLVGLVHRDSATGRPLTIGSFPHMAGRCKPCLFFHLSKCLKGVKCNFCHFNHSPNPHLIHEQIRRALSDNGSREKFNRLRPSKRTRDMIKILREIDEIPFQSPPDSGPALSVFPRQAPLPSLTHAKDYERFLYTSLRLIMQDSGGFPFSEK